MPRRSDFVRKHRFFAVLTLVGVLAVVWCARWLLTPAVNVTHVVDGPVVQAFYATGTVRPVREYPIRSAAAGILEKVLVDKGTRVKAGDVLAVVADPGLAYQAANADAMLEEMKKTIDAETSPVLIEFDAKLAIVKDRQQIAQRDVDRMNAMARIAAVSTADKDVALDKLKMLDSDEQALVKQRAAKLLDLQRDLKTAQAGYDAAHWQLDQQTLRAPIDGVVLDRPTSQGTRVAVNDVLMRVADVRPANLVMRAQVDEEDVTHCRPGQLVRMSLYAFASQPITGRVRQIYDEADPERRTFEVDVAFDVAQDRLASGMTGELAFVQSEKASARVLPSTAVQGGRVAVVRGGTIVEPDVKIGLRSVERVEILAGLADDDDVVVSPLGGLAAGDRVRAHYVTPASATPAAQTAEVNSGAATLKAF